MTARTLISGGIQLEVNLIQATDILNGEMRTIDLSFQPVHQSDGNAHFKQIDWASVQPIG